MPSEPYFSWREDDFALDILLHGEVDPELLEVGDSIITLPTGEEYSALMVTREEIVRIMDRHAETGESLHGRFFCVPDLIVIRGRGVTEMVDVVREIVRLEKVSKLLPRIAGEGQDSLPHM